jgi:serine/threonine protein kinase
VSEELRRSPPEGRGTSPGEEAEDVPSASISGTALGPADVRDTPLLEPLFVEDDEEDEGEEDPWLGRLLSNVYLVEERIGEGGMGAVYAAHHVHLEKRFAVKVLTPSVLERTNAVDRLKQEAVAASKIDHENIVDVVNFDQTDDGAVYIVMELLKGEDLADTIGRGPLSIERALPITFQLCRALHAAHEHGIIHRDLKPENIFLTTKRGRSLVKILDFGISKVKDAKAEQVRMTRTGQLVGTPLYMSPEQARGETEIDRRVDVYAAGVILYEMITGATPFEGRNYFELLWKHGNEDPPPMGERNPNVFVPEALEPVLVKALAKQPEDRYATMRELEEALLAAVPEVPELPSLHSLPPERGVSSPSAVGGRVLRRAALATTFEREAPLPLTEARRRTETEPVELPPNRTPVLVGVLAGLLVLAALFAFAGSGPSGEAEVTTAPAPAAPADVPPDPPSPAPAPDPVEPGVAPPATVSVELTSEPPGATVRLGDRELGETPLVVPLEVSEDAVRLSFSRSGYLDASRTVIVSRGLTVPSVRLRRRRGPRPDTPSSLPIKTGL